MRGLIDPTKKISFQDHKLEYSREELRKVVTVIVEKFVALQRENPLLALEALFKIQSADIK